MVADFSHPEHLLIFSQEIIMYGHLRLTLESSSLPFSTRIVRNVKRRWQHVRPAVKDLACCGASVFWWVQNVGIILLVIIHSHETSEHKPRCCFLITQTDFAARLFLLVFLDGLTVPSSTFAVVDHHVEVERIPSKRLSSINSRKLSSPQKV